MSGHVDGAERTGRAKILTSSATDTFFYIHYRNLWRILIIGVGRHHLNSSRRAMAGTVATLHAIRQWYAVFFYPNSVADLSGGFICRSNRMNGACRTDFRTFGALRAAISALV